MTKHSRRHFENELQQLFRARSNELISHLWPSRGKVERLSPRKIQLATDSLKAIANKHYLSSVKARSLLQSYDNKKQWHTKKGKGWSRAAKKQAFKHWYGQHIETMNCVYIFWNNRKCLYVGRTLNGKGRPSAHFEKYWFNRCTRIDIYSFSRQREVPRFECVMTHKLNPAKAKNKPSSKRYSSNCPICENNSFITEQVRSMFPFRKKRRH